MRGKHKHKWDFLRSVLAEKVVYDDNNIRVWYAPGGSGGGLLFYAKQAQVRLQRTVRPCAVLSVPLHVCVREAATR